MYPPNSSQDNDWRDEPLRPQSYPESQNQSNNQYAPAYPQPPKITAPTYADLPPPTNAPGDPLGRRAVRPYIAAPQPASTSYDTANSEYSQANQQQPKKKSGFKKLLKWLFVLLLLAALGAGGYYAYSNYIAGKVNVPVNVPGATKLSPEEEVLKKALESQLAITTFRESGTIEVKDQPVRTLIMDHDYSDPSKPMTKGTLRYDVAGANDTPGRRAANFISISSGDDFWRLTSYERQADRNAPLAKNLAALKGDWVRYDAAAKERMVPVMVSLPPTTTLDKWNTPQGPVIIGYLNADQRKDFVDQAIKNKVYKISKHERTQFGGRPSNKLEMTVDMTKLKELNKKFSELAKQKYVSEDAQAFKKLTLWSDAESGLPQQLVVEYDNGKATTHYTNINQAVLIAAPQGPVTEAEALQQ